MRGVKHFKHLSQCCYESAYNLLIYSSSSKEINKKTTTKSLRNLSLFNHLGKLFKLLSPSIILSFTIVLHAAFPGAYESYSLTAASVIDVCVSALQQ